jgi:hypothetical protein
MKRVDLEQIEHSVKIGEKCGNIEPNITEDCIFYADGEPIGFFMREIPEKLKSYIEIANKEFRSKNVPKSSLDRKPTDGFDEKRGVWKYKNVVKQWSTILGSVAPKPHMRRPYPTISSVHSVKTANTFIKAMLLAAKESEKLIKQILPKQHEKQLELFKNVDKEWRFGNLFTSSISNYNIPAPFHKDTANIKGAVNVIITKRRNSKGGNLNIPEYGATIDQCDNSILVYPAWRNVHGVTPIESSFEDGYRNSLIFYPLKAFVNK